MLRSSRIAPCGQREKSARIGGECALVRGFQRHVGLSANHGRSVVCRLARPGVIGG